VPRSTRPIAAIQAEVRALADPERAASTARFFKTGHGEYGEGDQFAGLTLPQVRALARKHKDLSVDHAFELLRSPIHEERSLALLILVRQYQRRDHATRDRIYRLYLDNTAYVNNWDLVDGSAEHIVGPQLDGQPKDVLDNLAASDSVWERRIAMLATFHYIKQGDPAPALHIAEALLQDKHDLIHKAVGWMLREVGKRCGHEHLTRFLDAHAATMPRTALRYALEHFPPDERKRYMGVKAAMRRNA
jgi:3-methyladenine DNA glycosylase AlkD